MDLVASYNSDESENENKKSSAKIAIKSKKIDLIEIIDSDTDMNLQGSSESGSLNFKTKPLDDKQTNCSKENDKTPAVEIECIDIDSSSDSDEDQNVNKKVSMENLSSTFKEQSENNKVESKKIDYLNLDGSDSEEVVSDGVNKLLDTAAVLNDVPCGPEKREVVNEALIDVLINLVNKSESDSHPLISPSLKSNDSSLPCSSKMRLSENISGVVQEKTSISTDFIANKRFKRETETPKSTVSASNTDMGENEESFVQSSFMYRKDERITTAFAKSVVCRLPRQITRHLVSHVNVVTALHWCVPQYSHLLLSASADCTIKIWDMYCRHPVQTIKDNLGLKAAKWSLSGEQIVTGGYGKKARVYDVLSGKEIISYDIFHYVNSIEVHPYMDDIFLCGTRNAIFGFDLRVNTHLPIRTFISKCEEVLDIIYLDENEFICSTSVVSHDSADRTIMVWDFSSGAIMSNQVYLERYTCPSLKVHPYDSCFIAQTNGDYIAAFSTQNPYKIKDKRYMGHKVSGFGVECDISPDGKYIASGDANGDIYFYSYANTNLINKLTVRPNTATNKLKWHPALNSTLATATWDGHIQILK